MPVTALNDLLTLIDVILGKEKKLLFAYYFFEIYIYLTISKINIIHYPVYDPEYQKTHNTDTYTYTHKHLLSGIFILILSELFKFESTSES